MLPTIHSFFSYLLSSVLRFTSSFMTAIRRRRTKAVVLYATETARSQTFARQLAEMLDYAFDSRSVCMEDYDAADLKKESLVYFVASTFGDGDPPENGRVSVVVTTKIRWYSGNSYKLTMRVYVTTSWTIMWTIVTWSAPFLPCRNNGLVIHEYFRFFQSFFSQLSAMAKSAEKDRKNRGYTDDSALLRNIQ